MTVQKRAKSRPQQLLLMAHLQAHPVPLVQVSVADAAVAVVAPVAVATQALRQQPSNPAS